MISVRETGILEQHMITSGHVKDLAYELATRFSLDRFEKLAGMVAGALVDLNLHQVDAALFARDRRAAEEFRILASLRNTLVPKLISGDPRFENTERFIGRTAV